MMIENCFRIVVAAMVCSGAATIHAADRPEVLVVIGAAGAEEYNEPFQDAALKWKHAAENAEADFKAIGLAATSQENAEPISHRDQMAEWISQRADQDSTNPLWIVMIGHGTYSGGIAKFNLTGPDVSAQQLAEWLKPIKRPLVIINGASASGPFLTALSAKNRVVVTATRDGAEQNYARFGEFLADSIAAPTADLDHDASVSILEAYLMASAKTRDFYESEDRLATEHALLDDNGDARGTAADFYSGTRAVKKTSGTEKVDGQMARYVTLYSAQSLDLTDEQRKQRQTLEQRLETLRDQKDKLDAEQYYQQLEQILKELAAFYETVDP